jgi:hypothetical protein
LDFNIEGKRMCRVLGPRLVTATVPPNAAVKTWRESHMRLPLRLEVVHLTVRLKRVISSEVHRSELGPQDGVRPMYPRNLFSTSECHQGIRPSVKSARAGQNMRTVPLSGFLQIGCVPRDLEAGVRQVVTTHGTDHSERN